MKRRFLWSLLALTQIAQGDALLVASTPPADAKLSHFAGQVIFRFRGNISAQAPSLVVVDEFGNRVDRGDMQIRLTEDGAELATTTPPLTLGRYAVRYRVLTEDGLVLSGIQHFTIH